MPLITLENGVGNNANGATNYYYSGITLAGQALGSYKDMPCPKEQMRQQNSFEGFDFENVWKVEDNYPILRFIPQNFYDLIAGGSRRILLPLRKRRCGTILNSSWMRLMGNGSTSPLSSRGETLSLIAMPLNTIMILQDWVLLFR